MRIIGMDKIPEIVSLLGVKGEDILGIIKENNKIGRETRLLSIQTKLQNSEAYLWYNVHILEEGRDEFKLGYDILVIDLDINVINSRKNYEFIFSYSKSIAPVYTDYLFNISKLNDLNLRREIGKTIKQISGTSKIP